MEPLLHRILGIEVIRTTPNRHTQGGCGTHDVLNELYSKLITIYIHSIFTLYISWALMWQM